MASQTNTAALVDYDQRYETIQHIARSTKAESSESLEPFSTVPKPTGNTTERMRRGSGFTYSHGAMAAPVAERNIDQQARSDVDGSIVEVKDASVTCEIYLADENIEISLPRAFFPDNIRYGMAINLRIDESSGIRKPIIRTREPSIDALSYGEEEFSALINELDD